MIRKPMLITDLVVDRGAVLSAVSGNISGNIGAIVQGDSILPAPTQNIIGRPNVPLEALDASVSLSIDGSSSSATIRLAEGTNVDGRAYVEMFTAQGSAGVFRTRSPRVGYGATSTTLQLEHAVNEIGDFIIDAKIQDEFTLEGAMRKIFSYYTPKSGLWRLGQVQAPMTGNGFEVFDRSGMNLIVGPSDSSVTMEVVAEKDCILDIDHDNCLDAIRGVLEQYPCMMMSFDFSSRPWTLNIVNRQGIVSAEGRLSRNVKSAVVTRDDSELCTKAWIEGYKKKGEFGAYENKAASAKYGLIERVISGANDTPKAAKQTAKTYVQNHHEPRITVTIDGIDLSRITGETMDKFTIGKLMRLALPDYGETVTETITGINFSSIYRNPDAVSITLNQEEDKVIRYIKKAQQTASRAGRSAARVASTAILDMSVKDNVLTLTKGDGTSVNFSKATALDGSWSGGIYTAKATQTNRNTGNGALVTTQVATRSTVLNGIKMQAGQGTSVVDTYYVNVPLKVTYRNGTGSSDTGYKETVKVSAYSVYQAGFNSVTITSVRLAKNFEPLRDNDLRSNIYIAAYASNGASKDDTLFQLTAPVKYAGNTKNCVNLRRGDDVIGRVNIDSVYNEGWNAVTVTAIHLASNFEPLGNNDTRQNVYIQADASNGKSKTDGLFVLSSPTTYSSGTKRCVNLRDSAENVVIGRVNVDSVYTEGWNAVTVTAIHLASNFSPLGNNDTRTTVYIQADASNGNSKTDGMFTLSSTTYSSGSKRCVNLQDVAANVVIGRINIDSVYQKGYEDGQASYSSKTLRCTEVTPTYPGSSSNYYYFRLEGRYSFSANTNYTMYRTSW